ncbi:hypothetical protein GCM10022254_09340 [Actinomadura meridiana]|uniref:Uncharacterized protein n=2 Tax=Actinomadura meridiana TaxID=559626 RepID=A0ABP8BTN3_9ACTN
MAARGWYRNDLFAESASPEAIAIHLDDERRAAKASAAAFARRIAWLEQLRERRTAEKAAGTWPDRPADTNANGANT